MLTLDDTQGMFYLLAAGILIGLTILTAEIIIHCVQEKFLTHYDNSDTTSYWGNESIIDYSWNTIRRNTIEFKRRRISNITI